MKLGLGGILASQAAFCDGGLTSVRPLWALMAPTNWVPWLRRRALPSGGSLNGQRTAAAKPNFLIEAYADFL